MSVNKIYFAITSIASIRSSVVGLLCIIVASDIPGILCLTTSQILQGGTPSFINAVIPNLLKSCDGKPYLFLYSEQWWEPQESSFSLYLLAQIRSSEPLISWISFYCFIERF